MFDLLKRFERLLVVLLMLMMAAVLALASVDLAWLLIQDILSPPVFILGVSELLDIFGLFMLVLIGIELLETIMKTYLTQGMPHFEVVLSVALIAIARKVIILDVKETESGKLLGIAAIVIALSAGYFLMRRSHAGPPPGSGGEPGEGRGGDAPR